MTEHFAGQLSAARRVVPRWASLAAAIGARARAHGNVERWADALERLPDVAPSCFDIGDIVAAGAASDLDEHGHRQLRAGLEGLHPWRKGPFRLFGTVIDSEWRSDYKWRRVAAHLPALSGTVLDVGAGNGYYGWRMLAAGADTVVGVDPTLVFAMQHLALARYLDRAFAGTRANVLLPLALDDLPAGRGEFDTVFSMGVIYHRRDPRAHLARLFGHVKPGGRAIVESLVVTDGRAVLEPRGRYARMRNVHVLPSPATLTGWLGEAGFAGAEVIALDATTADEQRSTPWMRFESLAQSLDPSDPRRTVEGHPAPVRAVAMARRSG